MRSDIVGCAGKHRAGRLIIILLGLVLVAGCGRKPETGFRRLAIENLSAVSDVTEITGLEEQIALLRENIPAGRLIRFAEAGQIRFAPGETGEKGLFFTFRVHSLDRRRVKTRIALKRNQRLITLKEFNKVDYYHSYSQEMPLEPGDEVVVQFFGDGLAIVNRPVIYDIIAARDNPQARYVFLIALDTMRFDRLPAKRAGKSITPALEGFMDDCLVFDRAYSQSSWTLPSFASLFTGLYEFNHGMTRDTSLDEGVPFLVETLARRFFTVNLNGGLWMQGKFGFSRGFDFFSVQSSPKDSLGGRILFDEALAFLRSHRLPSIFMLLHTYQIHSPYAPPDRYRRKLAPGLETKSLDSFFYREQFRTDIPDEQREAMELLYDAEIMAFDDFFADFIDGLKELDIYERSMIIFFSDHGEEFFEHGGWAHGHAHYEESIRVPCCIKFPGGQYAGQRVSDPVGLIDLLPTVLAHYSLPARDGIDGIDLAPVIRGEQPSRPLLVSSTSVTRLHPHISPRFALLRGKHKLIYQFPPADGDGDFFSPHSPPARQPAIRLFDLERDPGEKTPLSGEIKRKLLHVLLPEMTRIKAAIQASLKRKSGRRVSLSEEEREKLKSLGYL